MGNVIHKIFHIWRRYVRKLKSIFLNSLLETYYYFFSSEFTDIEVAFDTTKEQLRQAISDEECLNTNDEDIFSLYFHGENANDE